MGIMLTGCLRSLIIPLVDADGSRVDEVFAKLAYIDSILHVWLPVLCFGTGLDDPVFTRGSICCLQCSDLSRNIVISQVYA